MIFCDDAAVFLYVSIRSIGFGITILFPFLRLLLDNRLHG